MHRNDQGCLGANTTAIDYAEEPPRCPCVSLRQARHLLGSTTAFISLDAKRIADARGAYFRSSLASFAKFAAIRCAWSFLSCLAADRQPASPRNRRKQACAWRYPSRRMRLQDLRSTTTAENGRKGTQCLSRQIRAGQFDTPYTPDALQIGARSPIDQAAGSGV